MRNNPRRMVWTRFWSIYVLCGLVWAALGIPAPVSADSAGSAIYFDGVNDFIDINETLQIIGPTWKNTKSVSLWIKPEGTGQPCLEGGDVAFCDVILGDLPRFWGVVRGVRSPGQGQPAVDRIWIWNFDSWTTGSDVIGVAYTPGEWIHIAVVHTGGSLTVYVNGVTYPAWTIASGDTISPDNPSQQPHLHLGGVINSPTRISTFEGQIDEVRIYSTAISASDIQANYQSELVGNEPGLEAYYKMSDGTGLSLTDDSGQGWTGTLYDGNASAPADGHVPEWVASTAFDSLPPTPTPPTPTATSTATTTLTVTPSQTVTSTVTTTPIPTDTPTPGSAGYALFFDGANDFVEVANTGDMIGPNWAVTKSFSVWIKPEGSAPVCQNDVVAFCDLILSDTFRYWGISRGVRAPSPGQSAIDRIWIYNQDSTDGSYNQRAISIAYVPGQWLHIAVVHANGLLTVYVNGQTRAELQTASAATQGFPGTLTIGGAINGSRVTTFQGLIDEVRIYSSAITQSEVVNSIQNELTGGEPGLAVYYKMSDGTGLSLTDNGVNGWTGTLKDGTGSSSPDGHSPHWIGSDAFDAPLDLPNPAGDWTIYLPLTMNP